VRGKNYRAPRSPRRPQVCNRDDLLAVVYQKEATWHAEGVSAARTFAAKHVFEGISCFGE
jgi:hypothetical protein